MKPTLKIEIGERRSQWLLYVSIAVLIYKTSYHAGLGCEPDRFFHGRIPYIILDIKAGIRLQQAYIPTPQIAQDDPDQTQMSYQVVHRNVMQNYVEYKAY